MLDRKDGTLIASARACFARIPASRADFNELFLARDDHRLGLGRRLLADTARRCDDAGVLSMSAYVNPRNPSCGFFEKLGGQWLIEPNGRGNFSWYSSPDLERFR